MKFGFERDFWTAIDKLVAESQIIIDRPKGTQHPNFLNTFYPVDYGYLKDTTSMDKEGIDLWLGTSGREVDAIICIVDLFKKDSEIKLLMGCTPYEKELVLHFHNQFDCMKGILIPRKP